MYQLEEIKIDLDIYKLTIGKYPEALIQLNSFNQKSGYIFKTEDTWGFPYKYKRISDEQYELLSEGILLYEKSVENLEKFRVIFIICLSIIFILLLIVTNKNAPKIYFFVISFLIYIIFISHLSIILFFKIYDIFLCILTFVSALLFGNSFRKFFFKYSALDFLILITSFNSLCLFLTMII